MRLFSYGFTYLFGMLHKEQHSIGGEVAPITTTYAFVEIVSLALLSERTDGKERKKKDDDDDW